MPRLAKLITLLLATAATQCGPSPAEFAAAEARAARDELAACLARDAEHDAEPAGTWAETAPARDIPREDLLGVLGGEIGEVFVGGGLTEIAYWPPGDDLCANRPSAPLPFATLAHDRLDGLSGFVSGLTDTGLGVVAEYRVTGAGLELRRLAQAACLGRLTGLVIDDVGNRLLLWDSGGGQLFELRFDVERDAGSLRRLLDAGAAPQLAGYRAIWWMQSGPGTPLRLCTEGLSDAPDPALSHALLHVPARDGARACRVQIFDGFDRALSELVELPPPRVPDALPLPDFEAWHVR